MTDDPQKTPGPSDFERAAEKPNASLGAELLAYLAQNKKWWLTPIVVVLLLLGVLIFLGGTSAAPFVYTLF